MKLSVTSPTDEHDWQSGISESIANGTPALLRNDGSLHLLSDAKELLDFRLQKDDCYIHGPHGEMVPFVALARKHNVIDDQGTLFHTDSHADNRIEGVELVPKQYLAGCEPKYTSGKTRWAVRHLIEDNENTQERFQHIINVTRGDIDTWVDALDMQFSDIITQLRSPGTLNVHRTKPNRVATWTATYGLPELHKSADGELDMISSVTSPISTVSLDADYCGITFKDESQRENDPQEEDLEREIYSTMMESVLRSMQLVLQKSRPIYTISTDPNWVKYPEQFCKDWIEKFYIPTIVKQNTVIPKLTPPVSAESNQGSSIV